MAKEMRIRGHPSVAEMGVGGGGEGRTEASSQKRFCVCFPALLLLFFLDVADWKTSVMKL